MSSHVVASSDGYVGEVCSRCGKPTKHRCGDGSKLAEALRDNDALTETLVKYRALYEAALYMDDHGGLGSDRVRECARRIKAVKTNG
jgi:hypothetical protein